jgi:DNA-binding transcriptional ArsR family regulator
MNELLVQLYSIASANAPTPAPVARFNPRPAGVIREGSASDAILKCLRETGGFKTEAQILLKTGRSHSAVSWSLLYLQRLGLVEAMPETHRNSRYQRYRATPQEKNHD